MRQMRNLLTGILEKEKQSPVSWLVPGKEPELIDTKVHIHSAKRPLSS